RLTATRPAGDRADQAEVVQQHVRRNEHADQCEHGNDHAVERRGRIVLRLHRFACALVGRRAGAHEVVAAPAAAPVICRISCFAPSKSFQFCSWRPFTNTVGVPRTPSWLPSSWFAVTVAACASLSRQLRNAFMSRPSVCAYSISWSAGVVRL